MLIISKNIKVYENVVLHKLNIAYDKMHCRTTFFVFLKLYFLIIHYLYCIV